MLRALICSPAIILAFLVATAGHAAQPIDIKLRACDSGEGRLGLDGRPLQWATRLQQYYYPMVKDAIVRYQEEYDSAAAAAALRICPLCTRDERDALVASITRPDTLCQGSDLIGPASPYELPSTVHIVQSRLCEIAAVARERFGAGLPKVSCTTVPTFCFQASTWPMCDRSEALILVQFGLLDLLAEISKVCTAPLGVDDDLATIDLDISPTRVSERLRDHPEIANRFAELAQDYFVGMYKWGQWSVGGERELLAGELLAGMEIFVLSHEYAHVALRHEVRNVLPASLLRPSGGEPSVQIEVPRPEWAQEIAADSLGMLLTIEVLKREKLRWNIAYAGPHVFCDVLGFVGKVEREVLGSSSLSDDLHPDPDSRRGFVDRTLQSQDTPAYEANMDILGFTDRFFDGLWIFAGPTVVANGVQNKGVRERFDCRRRAH